MKLVNEKNIELVNKNDRKMTAADIIPYQKVNSDFRETCYQYEFLDNKSKRVIDDMLLIMEHVYNAFHNVNEEGLEEEQSIYDAIATQLQFDIGQYVTAFIEGMNDEELKKNIIAAKGEKWAKEKGFID